MIHKSLLHQEEDLLQVTYSHSNYLLRMILSISFCEMEHHLVRGC